MSLPQAVEFSHTLMKKYVEPGDTVLDATCGNGYDTVYLAELVGNEGLVKAIDIQEEAVNNTTTRLRRQNLEERAEIIRGDHSRLEKLFSGEEFAGIIFNLGYLPGGDKDVITEKNTTLKALDQALDRIVIGGVIVVVAYPGHEGGRKECKAVREWAENLDPDPYNVLHYHFINQPSHPPQVFAIELRES